MAVPGRNWTLFRWVFRPHYHVQSPVAQNFRIKSKAHMCYVDLSGIHIPSLRIWTPPLTKVLCHSTSNALMQSNMQRNNVRSLPRTATFSQMSWITKIHVSLFECCPLRDLPLYIYILCCITNWKAVMFQHIETEISGGLKCVYIPLHQQISKQQIENMPNL